MSDEERQIMARHAAHWRPWIESGQMVIFGPVLDSTGSWGLGVVEADDEQELRAFAADDPVVTTGTGTIEVGKMLGGFVRPRQARASSASARLTRSAWLCPAGNRATPAYRLGGSARVLPDLLHHAA
jgi:uncharacterized protein YciI